jgi:hypothetical protein
MIAAMREAHNEQLRIFREVEGVEKALLQQIVKAVDAPYLAALRDRASNSLRGPVYQVIDHLQTVYGRVSPQMLENREQELRTMLYNAKFPIDIVFNAVEDFVDFAVLGQQPVTQRQTIAKAYVIINKTSRFKQAITEWNRKPDLQKTWINFKAHFRQAHQEFRETTDVTLEESELHRNNANLVQQVVDGLQGALTPVDNTPNESVALMQQMANAAAQSNETQQQLTAQIAQMQQAMTLLQSQVQQQPYQQPAYQQQPYLPPPYNPPFHQRGGGRSYPGNQSRGARGRGRGSSFRQRNTAIYC